LLLPSPFHEIWSTATLHASKHLEKKLFYTLDWSANLRGNIDYLSGRILSERAFAGHKLQLRMLLLDDLSDPAGCSLSPLVEDGANRLLLATHLCTAIVHLGCRKQLILKLKYLPPAGKRDVNSNYATSKAVACL